jgi:hypothetical protein
MAPSPVAMGCGRGTCGAAPEPGWPQADLDNVPFEEAPHMKNTVVTPIVKSPQIAFTYVRVCKSMSEKTYMCITWTKQESE